MIAKPRVNALGDDLAERDGDGVSELAHAFGPRAMKFIVVRKRLKPGGFPHREIPNAAVLEGDHVFAPRNAVIARLERFGWFVQRTAGMPWIDPSARHQPMIQEQGCITIPLGIGQPVQAVAHGSPRFGGGHGISAR